MLILNVRQCGMYNYKLNGETYSLRYLFQIWTKYTYYFTLRLQIIFTQYLLLHKTVQSHKQCELFHKLYTKYTNFP